MTTRARPSFLSARWVLIAVRLTKSLVIGTGLGILVPGVCLGNNKVSFVVDGYYFELYLGINRGDYRGHPDYEFFSSATLPNSTVFKEHFKHVLRIELPRDGSNYQGLDLSHVTKAKSEWSPSKRLLLVTFIGRAIIMSPDYSILKCYRNVESVKWVSDSEIFANVETSHPKLYSRENFIINIEKDRVRRAQTD